MLHNLFDGHEDACIYPVDLSIFYAYFPKYTSDDSYSAKDLLDRIKTILEKNLAGVFSENKDLEFNRFWKRFSELVKPEELRNKKSILTAILTAWKQEIGDDSSRPFIVKETTQSVYIHEILAAFPTCRIIHLLRDPRDNYGALKSGVKNYYSKMGEDERKTLASLINRVRLDFQSARINLQNHPENFTTVRFEDLVTDTENQMKKLAGFCGLPFRESMLEPTRYGKFFTGNSHENKKFEGVSDENVARWRDRISENEARIIEYWLGDLMEHFGYKLAFPHAESQAEFSEFYGWYNAQYFQNDPYQKSN